MKVTLDHSLRQLHLIRLPSFFNLCYVTMNWTGGARARAYKASTGIAAKQRQYFARVRAQATSTAFMGSPSPSARNHNENERDEDEEDEEDGLNFAALKKRRKVPRFDIIVGNQKGGGSIEAPGPKTSEKRSVSPAPVLGERVKRLKKESIKSRKNLLLETDDWVCTTVAAPLKQVSSQNTKERKKPPAVPALERLRQQSQPPLSFNPRASQAITEAATECRDYPDTGFNTFKPLSQGGYVRIGKGKPLDRVVEGPMLDVVAEENYGGNPRKESAESQDTMLFDEEELQRSLSPCLPPDVENSRAPIAGPSNVQHDDRLVGTYYFQQPLEQFEPITSLRRMIEDSNRQFASPAPETEEDVEDDGYLPPNLPRSTPPVLPPSKDTEDIDELLRQIEEAAATSTPRFPSLDDDAKRLRSNTPSSPTSYVTHFVSRGIESDSPEVTAVEEEQSLVHTPEDPECDMKEPENEEAKEDDVELPPPREINPSVVAFASSSRGFVSSDAELESEVSSTFFGDPPPNDLNSRWRKFLQPPGLDDNTKDVDLNDESDRDDTEEWEKFEGHEDGKVSTGANRGSQDDGNEPGSEMQVAGGTEGMENTGEVTNQDEMVTKAGNNNEVGKYIPERVPLRKSVPTAREEPVIPKDIDTKWKEFVSAGLKETAAIKPSATLNLEKVVSGVNLPPPPPPPPKSPPILLSFTEEENRAWREFVFGSSALDDSDDDELFIVPPPKSQSGKYFTALTAAQAPSSSPPRPNGKHFTALTATQVLSSSPPRIELSPYYPVRNGSSSSVNATQGSSTPLLPRSLRIAKGNEAVLEDSLAGNVSSSPLVQSEPAKFAVAMSMVANPSSSVGDPVSPGRDVRTWTRPKKFVGNAAAPIDGLEDIEDW